MFTCKSTAFLLCLWSENIVCKGAVMEHYHQSSYRRSGRHRQKPASEWPHILLFYILPFIVFNAIVFHLVTAKPRFELTVADTSDYQTTTATLTMKSWLPAKSIVLELDGENLELTKDKKRTYTTTLHRNGSLQAIVTNFNGMPADSIKYVNILDDTPPTFSASHIEEGVLTVTLTDSQAGINYDSVYALNSTGERVLPLVANRDLNTFSFTMDSAGLRIFVQDMAGNESQGSFTSHKENGSDVLDSAPEPEEEEGSEEAHSATAESTQAASESSQAESTSAEESAAKAKITIQ